MSSRFLSNSKALYTFLILVCIIGFWLFENFYTPGTYSTKEGDGENTEIPEMLLPTSTTNAIVRHNHYILSYNEPFEQAEWVAYVLKREHLTYDDRERPYFLEDPKVRTKSADWRNYKGSGYDRGHLCPAGDRRFSEQAYNETFYTSNITPQDRDFNAGIWNRLEMQVRQWAKRHGELFVVTGGVLEDRLLEIGEEDVDVPNHFYKIVVRGSLEKPEVISFLMPGVESSRPLKAFVVTVDSLEKKTGINFFERLPDITEVELEKRKRIGEWKFNE